LSHQGKELQKQLADILRIHPYLETAPVVIAVCALPDASPTWMMDLSAATENMLLAATAMGLGAAWIGSPNTVLDRGDPLQRPGHSTGRAHSDVGSCGASRPGTATS